MIALKHCRLSREIKSSTPSHLIVEEVGNWQPFIPATASPANTDEPNKMDPIFGVATLVNDVASPRDTWAGLSGDVDNVGRKLLYHI